MHLCNARWDQVYFQFPSSSKNHWLRLSLVFLLDEHPLVIILCPLCMALDMG